MEEHTVPLGIIEIRLFSTDYSVTLGSGINIPFTITNRTAEDGYFEVSVTGIPTTWLLLDLPVIRLAAGEQREAGFTIQAPDTSPVSIGEYPVTIQVISQSRPAWRGEARFNLHVGPVEATMPVAQPIPGAPQIPGTRVAIAMNMAQFASAPGETLSIPVLISNRGLHEESFFISVEGLPPSWVSSATPSVRLLPAESREVMLYIQPPQGPASRAGRHPFSVRVTAETDPGQTMAVDALLTLAATSQFSSDINPRRVDSGQPVRLRIHNLGNFPDSYTIRFQNVDGDLEFVPALTAPMQLQAGESGAVDFAASPRSPILFGSPTVLGYSVLVQSAGGETQGHNGEVVSRSLIPVWVLPLFAILCLGLLCGMGLLWNWNQSRLTAATRTAEAQVAMIQALTATAGATGFQAETAAAAAQTATAAALLSLPTETPAPTLTAAPSETALPPATETATVVPPTVTPTLPPPATATLPPPTATIAPVNTATLPPLPFTAEQQILIVSNRDGTQHLYLFSAADRSFHRITNEAGADTQPAWSPDGSRFLFTTNRDGNNEIYVANADGSSPNNLTRSPANDSFPAWSPDGKSIAFTTDRDGNNEIYSMNADGSNPVNLTKSPSNDYKPAWYAQRVLLAETTRILFSTDRDGNNEIYAMNPDGSGPVNLTNNPASDAFPSVPFRGGQVVFVSDRDGNSEIYRMALDGKSPLNLTNNPAGDAKPVWSQDGKWIAFTTDRDGNREVYVMDANGGSLVNITQSPSDDFDPGWK